jgi:hypothetical protein
MVVAPLGANLCAISPPPIADTQMTATLVRNAIIPASASDYLQIGREFLGLLYGYVVHLAMFKVAGEEFAATTQLADAFFEAAKERNKRLGDFSAFKTDTPDVTVAPQTAPASGVDRRTGDNVGRPGGRQGPSGLRGQGE